MGQKVNPIGLAPRHQPHLGLPLVRRTATTTARLLHEDIKVRKELKKRLGQAGVSRIIIERPHKQCRVTIYAARPGVIIGKKGADIDKLRKDLAAMTEGEVHLNIVEVRKPETDAQLVAENIAQQLERRVAFRRAMKRSMQIGHAPGRQGRPDQGLRPPRRRRDRADGMVPRRPRAAAHPARRHRLRLRRSQDHLRHHRREGLDLQRRGAGARPDGAGQAPGGRNPARPAKAAAASDRPIASRAARAATGATEANA